MNVPDISRADYAALLELAEARFWAWLPREWVPERDRRYREVETDRALGFAARAFRKLEILRELLRMLVRQQIRFYNDVARESGNAEMLFKSRLAECRERIMTSVDTALAALKGDIQQKAIAANVETSELPSENTFRSLAAEILHIVNVELKVLEAEGRLTGQAAATEASASGTSSPEPQESQRVTATADGSDIATERRAAVNAYIEEVFSRTGKRITRTDIWKSARYRTRTEFERWQRNDRNATKTAHERFTRILSEKPHLK